MLDAKVKDLARLYAGMTDAEVAKHEDWVRRYKAEQAEANAKWRAAVEERRATLRAADDVGAVQTILHACVDGDQMTDPFQAIQMLEDAGYRRVTKGSMAISIDTLKHAAQMPDTAAAHLLADKVICNLLKGAGMEDVVEAFKRVGKKYA